MNLVHGSLLFSINYYVTFNLFDLQFVLNLILIHDFFAVVYVTL